MKIALAALLISLGLAAHATDARLKSGVFDPPRVAPDFSLAGSDGKELHLSQYRGKVVVLGFGFSHCAEVCPVTLSKLANARKELGASGNEMQVVYVTVDPERDSPARLREYLAHFDPAFVGASGTAQQLEKVRLDYGITASKVASADPSTYFIDHSSFVYLIDRAGRLRAMVPYGRSAGDIAHDVAILLEQ
jgi:protein SCO1